jgi:hypothetical protein
LQERVRHHSKRQSGDQDYDSLLLEPVERNLGMFDLCTKVRVAVAHPFAHTSDPQVTNKRRSSLRGPFHDGRNAPEWRLVSSQRRTA